MSRRLMLLLLAVIGGIMLGVGARYSGTTAEVLLMVGGRVLVILSIIFLMLDIFKHDPSPRN